MRRNTWLLFILFHALYALTSSGNAFRIPDEFEVYFQTEHLIDAGDISVPQTLAILVPVVVDGKRVGQQSVFFGKVGRDGKPYAPYGPLAAVLAVPHHLAGRAMAGLAGIPRVAPPKGLAWVTFVGGITMLTTATAGALAVAGFHRAALALGTSPAAALVLSLLLGGATVLWPYATNLYSEAWQAAAFVWAAAWLFEARRSDGASDGNRARMKVIGAAALLAVAGLIKVTSLIFAPGFVLAALCDRSLASRRRVETATALALGIGVAAALHVQWNLFRFGAPFDFGYDWSETIRQLPPQAFLLSDIPRGLFVLLASPGKSLLLWAPALVLAALGAARFWTQHRGPAIGLAASAGIGLALYASYLFPEGGYAHGPRNLVPIVPLLLLPAAGAGAVHWRQPSVAICAAVGLIMALLSVSVSFFEDQAMVPGPGGQQRPGYYEVVDAPAGRPSNRYRLGYVPFVTALRSPGWVTSQNVGQGPDFFPLHLANAVRRLPDGRSLPGWFIWAWPALWGAIGIGAASLLWRRAGAWPGDGGDRPDGTVIAM